jgi:hypothetical protein
MMMWTAEKERRFPEPSPEIKALARAKFKERRVEEAQELCGPAGREWFEAMLVEYQAAHVMPASSGKARAGASSSPSLAEVAPALATLSRWERFRRRLCHIQRRLIQRRNLHGGFVGRRVGSLVTIGKGNFGNGMGDIMRWYPTISCGTEC